MLQASHTDNSIFIIRHYKMCSELVLLHIFWPLHPQCVNAAKQKELHSKQKHTTKIFDMEKWELAISEQQTQPL